MKRILIPVFCAILTLCSFNAAQAQTIVIGDPQPINVKVYRSDDGTSIGGTVTINVKNSAGSLLGSQTLTNGTYGNIPAMSGSCTFNVTVNALGVVRTSTYYPVPGSASAGATYAIFDMGTYSISVSIYRNSGVMPSYTLTAIQGPPLH